ncbi:hypothetical protein HDU76_000570, partial [Blyttiomyces sp. JEL0837]
QIPPYGGPTSYQTNSHPVPVYSQPPTQSWGGPHQHPAWGDPSTAHGGYHQGYPPPPPHSQVQQVSYDHRYEYNGGTPTTNVYYGQPPAQQQPPPGQQQPQGPYYPPSSEHYHAHVYPQPPPQQHVQDVWGGSSGGSAGYYGYPGGAAGPPPPAGPPSNVPVAHPAPPPSPSHYAVSGGYPHQPQQPPQDHQLHAGYAGYPSSGYGYYPPPPTSQHGWVGGYPPPPPPNASNGAVYGYHGLEGSPPNGGAGGAGYGYRGGSEGSPNRGEKAGSSSSDVGYSENDISRGGTVISVGGRNESTDVDAVVSEADTSSALMLIQLGRGIGGGVLQQSEQEVQLRQHQRHHRQYEEGPDMAAVEAAKAAAAAAAMGLVDGGANSVAFSASSSVGENQSSVGAGGGDEVENNNGSDSGKGHGKGQKKSRVTGSDGERIRPPIGTGKGVKWVHKENVNNGETSGSSDEFSMKNVKPDPVTGNYKCETCGKEFRGRANLRDHRRGHTRTRSFPCTVPGCNKLFLRTQDLARHGATHLSVNDRPFSCPNNCGKRFGRGDAANRHARLSCSVKVNGGQLYNEGEGGVASSGRGFEDDGSEDGYAGGSGEEGSPRRTTTTVTRATNAILPTIAGTRLWKLTDAVLRIPSIQALAFTATIVVPFKFAFDYVRSFSSTGQTIAFCISLFTQFRCTPIYYDGFKPGMRNIATWFKLYVAGTPGYLVMSFLTLVAISTMYFVGFAALKDKDSFNLVNTFATVIYVGFVYPLLKGLIVLQLRNTSIWNRAREDMLLHGVDFMGILEFELRKIINKAGEISSSWTVVDTGSGEKHVTILQNDVGHDTPKLQSKSSRSFKISPDPFCSIPEFVSTEIQVEDASDNDNFKRNGDFKSATDSNTMTERRSEDFDEQLESGSNKEEDPLALPPPQIVIDPEPISPLGQQKTRRSRITQVALKMSERSHSQAHTSKFLHLVEATISILELGNTSVECIGLEAIAYIISDLISKVSAIVVVFILLGYNSAWSLCGESIDLNVGAIEAVALVGISLFIEIPYTLWEASELGYELGDVIEVFRSVKLGWQSYGLFVTSAGSAVVTMVAVDAGMFGGTKCFEK